MTEVNSNFLSKYKDEFLKDLADLIEIQSYLKETDSYPNVKAIKDVLSLFSDIALRFGLRTHINDEGYFGYAEYGSEDLPEMVGILGHLDIVDAGDRNTWNTDPYKLVIDGDKLIGRGTSDDKGPTLVGLYLLRYLKDNNIVLDRRVRVIVATDEEVLWRGINKYLESQEKPVVAFTPDSSFPMYYAEKGLLQLQIKGGKSIIEAKLGMAFNSVPDKVEYEGPHSQEIVDELISNQVQFMEDGEKIVVFGEAKHAKNADKGDNAIFKFLKGMKNTDSENQMVQFLINEVKLDPRAINIFGRVQDIDTGVQTFNLGKLDLNKDECVASIDMRLPVTTMDKDEVMEILTKSADKYGLKVEEYDFLPKVYHERDGKLVTELMKIYQHHTGDMKSEPVATGGATYARAIPNCIAYGPSSPFGETTEHLPNEYALYSSLEKSFDIYLDAVKLLTEKGGVI